MQTKREYAASLGLAKLGVRGKLSRDAHAAIDKARDNGVTFSDDAPKAVVKVDRPKVAIRVVGDSKPKPELPTYDNRAVRDWAKKAGLNVGARGRIHPDIVKAYFDTNPDERHSETVDNRPVAETISVAKPVVRSQTTAYVVASGPKAWNAPKVIGFSTCASCHNSVNRCTHDMPVAPAYLSSNGTTVTAVSLSKPRV